MTARVVVDGPAVYCVVAGPESPAAPSPARDAAGPDPLAGPHLSDRTCSCSLASEGDNG